VREKTAPGSDLHAWQYGCLDCEQKYFFVQLVEIFEKSSLVQGSAAVRSRRSKEIGSLIKYFYIKHEVVGVLIASSHPP